MAILQTQYEKYKQENNSNITYEMWEKDVFTPLINQAKDTLDAEEIKRIMRLERPRLLDVMQEVNNIKLVRSFPIQFIPKEIKENQEPPVKLHPIDEMMDIIQRMQDINVEDESFKEIFEYVNKEDFQDIRMYLTERLHRLELSKLKK